MRNSGQLKKYSFDPSQAFEPTLVAIETDKVQPVSQINDFNNLTARGLNFDRLGLIVSLFGHGIIFYLVIFGIYGAGKVPENVIYSVSLEGSNKLGGIQQVPKGKQETPIAPPKNVSAPPPPKSEVKEQVKVPEKKVEKAVVPEEKAEISLQEKVKVKEEVKPKPEVKKAEVKPKAVPVPPQPQQQVSKQESKAKPVDTKAEANKNFEQALQRYLGESTNAGGTGFGGDGRGGRSMGGGIVKPPEWFLYKDALESAIKRGWNWHDSTALLVASVAFKISERGEVSDVRLVRSSGNSYYDESVIRAVRKASPVLPPPAQFYDDFRFVEFDFKPQ